MINPVEASVLAVGIGNVEPPDASERLSMLADKLNIKLGGTYEGDVCSILEALYERISDIEDSIRRLEDRP